jgi:hypothetical protein
MTEIDKADPVACTIQRKPGDSLGGWEIVRWFIHEGYWLQHSYEPLPWGPTKRHSIARVRSYAKKNGLLYYHYLCDWQKVNMSPQELIVRLMRV